MKKIGMRGKLIGVFLIISILPILVIGGISFSKSIEAIQDEVGFYSEKTITLMAKNIDMMIGEVNKDFISLMANRSVVDAANIFQKEHDYESGQTIKKALSTITRSNLTVKDNIFATPNGNIVNGSFKAGSDFIWESLEEAGIVERVLSSTDTIWLKGYKSESDLMAFRNIIDPDRGKSLGIGIFKVSVLEFQKQLGLIQEDEATELFIIDEETRVLVDKNQEHIGKLAVEAYPTLFDKETDYTFNTPNIANFGKDNFTIYSPCNNGKWQVVLTSSVSNILKGVHTIKFSIIAVGLFSACLAIIVAIIISGGVAKPIYHMVSQMRLAEKGDLEFDIGISGDKDIRNLRSSFKNMIGHIRELISQTIQVVGLVNANADDVKAMALSTKASAIQVSTSVEEIAAGANAQREEVEYSMERMKNLTASIGEVVLKIEDIAGVTKETTKISQRTTKTLKELNEQTEVSSQITKGIEVDIEKLDDNAREIIEVVHLIEGISEQTNLLSLNAAIEAARAGNYGKGFGVVADEVRKLATQSKEATMRIRSIMGNIENQLNQTVEGAKKAGQVFEKQRGIVQKTNEAFTQIIEAMNSIYTQMERINGSIGKMDQDKDEVVESMERIQTIVQETVAVTEELLAASSQQNEDSDKMDECADALTMNVNNLQETIATFKIK